MHLDFGVIKITSMSVGLNGISFLSHIANFIQILNVPLDQISASKKLLNNPHAKSLNRHRLILGLFNEVDLENGDCRRYSQKIPTKLRYDYYFDKLFFYNALMPT